MGCGRHILFSVLCRVLLAGSDSTGGASVSASAAVEAGVGIDRIDVAFLDGIGGTYALASTTSYAAVRNYISHSSVKILSDVVIN